MEDEEIGGIGDWKAKMQVSAVTSQSLFLEFDLRHLAPADPRFCGGCSEPG